jgi:predicted lysophospholipase L1 biosynthesis ABC-type transport system permease subunit
VCLCSIEWLIVKVVAQVIKVVMICLTAEYGLTLRNDVIVLSSLLSSRCRSGEYKFSKILGASRKLLGVRRVV